MSEKIVKSDGSQVKFLFYGEMSDTLKREEEIFKYRENMKETFLWSSSGRGRVCCHYRN